jgi:hypothetical protein
MIFLHFPFFLPTTLHFGVVMTVIIPLKNEFHISFQCISILLSIYSYRLTIIQNDISFSLHSTQTLKTYTYVRPQDLKWGNAG